MAKEVKDNAKTKVQGEETVVVKLPRIKNAEDPVFVSVGTYTCYIKRGEAVEVPWFVAEVLENQERMMDAREANEAANRYND